MAKKDVYNKEDVWGTIRFIVFIILLMGYVWTEWSQNATLRLNNKSIAILIEDKKDMQEQISDMKERLDYKMATRSDLDTHKKEIDDRLASQWDRIQDNQSEIYDLDEKLADRIPNWNKK